MKNHKIINEIIKNIKSEKIKVKTWLGDKDLFSQICLIKTHYFIKTHKTINTKYYFIKTTNSLSKADDFVKTINSLNKINDFIKMINSLSKTDDFTKTHKISY